VKGRAEGVRRAYFPEVPAIWSARSTTRDALPAGITLTGPAIVEERASTTVLPPGVGSRGRRIREPLSWELGAVTAPVDPITLGVVWGALQSIAVEIAPPSTGPAYSEQAREGQDFSVAVFDAAGRMVAQGPYSPGAHGRDVVRGGQRAGRPSGGHPRARRRDPAERSACSAPDTCRISSITQPAFEDGELVGFVVNILPHTDVGGQRPGSQGVEGIFDYFQEGLRIPPTKVWRRLPGAGGHRRHHRRQQPHAGQGARAICAPQRSALRCRAS